MNELLFLTYIGGNGISGVLVEMGQVLLNGFSKPLGRQPRSGGVDSNDFAGVILTKNRSY